MNEETLDIRRFARAVVRGKWIVIGCAIAGLVLGGVYSIVRAPRYTASTVLLLPPSSESAPGQPARDIETEVQVATSQVVLELASRSLPHQPDPAALKQQLSVSGPTSDVLVFKGHGDGSGDAIALSNAAAEAYRTYASKSALDQAAQVTAPLDVQIKDLRTTVDNLQTKINNANRQLAGVDPHSPQALTTTAQIAQWNSQQQDALQELQTDRAQVAQANATSDAAKASKIISPATSASNGAAKAGLINLLGGMLLGLIVGISIVIARDSRDRSLRLRSEIAAAAGVPAIASVSARTVHKPAEWVALLKSYEPSATEKWALRKLLRAILTAHSSPPAQLTVVTLASDDAAVTVAPQIATYAASGGMRTVLVVDARTPALLALHKIRDLAAVSGAPPRDNLSIVEEWPAPDFSDDTPAIDLVVRVVVADEDGFDLSDSAPMTALLAVSAGAATLDEIHSVAATAAEQGHPLAGIVVANPEAHDTSDGTLPDAATAEAGARQAPSAS